MINGSADKDAHLICNIKLGKFKNSVFTSLFISPFPIQKSLIQCFCALVKVLIECDLWPISNSHLYRQVTDH